MYVIKEELYHSEEKLAKIILIFLSRRLDPDPVQLFRIRIRPGRKVPGPKPQHWVEWLGKEHFTVFYARIDIWEDWRTPRPGWSAYKLCQPSLSSSSAFGSRRFATILAKNFAPSSKKLTSGSIDCSSIYVNDNNTSQVFWGRAHFLWSTLLFCMALVLNTARRGYFTCSNDFYLPRERGRGESESFHFSENFRENHPILLP